MNLIFDCLEITNPSICTTVSRDEQSIYYLKCLIIAGGTKQEQGRNHEAGFRRNDTADEARGKRHLFRGECDEPQGESPDTGEGLGQHGLLDIGQVSRLQGEALHPRVLAESLEEVDDLEGHELLVELVDVEGGDVGQPSSHQLRKNVLGPEEQYKQWLE